MLQILIVHTIDQTFERLPVTELLPILHKKTVKQKFGQRAQKFETRDHSCGDHVVSR